MDEQIQQKIDEIKAKITPPFIARVVVRGIAKHSVGFIAANLAKTYCPTENKKQELQVTAGAYFIGQMAGGAAADYAEQELNDILEFVKGIRKTADELTETSYEDVKPEVSATE